MRSPNECCTCKLLVAVSSQMPHIASHRITRRREIRHVATTWLELRKARKSCRTSVKAREVHARAFELACFPTCCETCLPHSTAQHSEACLEWSGAEWSGVEWSGVEWSGARRGPSRWLFEAGRGRRRGRRRSDGFEKAMDLNSQGGQPAPHYSLPRACEEKTVLYCCWPALTCCLASSWRLCGEGRGPSPSAPGSSTFRAVRVTKP